MRPGFGREQFATQFRNARPKFVSGRILGKAEVADSDSRQLERGRFLDGLKLRISHHALGVIARAVTGLLEFSDEPTGCLGLERELTPELERLDDDLDRTSRPVLKELGELRGEAIGLIDNFIL